MSEGVNYLKINRSCCRIRRGFGFFVFDKLTGYPVKNIHPIRFGKCRSTHFRKENLIFSFHLDDRILFMKGIDVSYFYEGYSEFKTEEL